MSTRQSFLEAYVGQAFPDPEKIVYAGSSMYYPINRALVLKIELCTSLSYDERTDTAYGFRLEIDHKTNGLISTQYLDFKKDLGVPRYAILDRRWFNETTPYHHSCFSDRFKTFISKYVRLWIM